MTHWTKRIQAHARVDLAGCDAFEAGIQDLEEYLQSEKFSSDTTVQVQDVLNRIRAAHCNATDAEYRQYQIEKEAGNL